MGGLGGYQLTAHQIKETLIMRARSFVSRAIAVMAAVVAVLSGLSGTGNAEVAGLKTIYNVGSVNGCMDITSHGVGTPVTLYRCHLGRDSQKFDGPGDGTIRSYGSGQCLDVSSYNPGAVVHLRPCEQLISQYWVGSSDDTIRPAGNINMCMDLTSYNNGTPVTLYSCHSGKSQQWRNFNV